jgi:hypothetical protein
MAQVPGSLALPTLSFGEAYWHVAKGYSLLITIVMESIFDEVAFVLSPVNPTIKPLTSWMGCNSYFGMMIKQTECLRSSQFGISRGALERRLHLRRNELVRWHA